MIFITAEIGVNWDGDYLLLEKMMYNAKNSGCNAIKLQSFNEKIVSEHNEKERLLKSSVSKENIERIDSLSKKVGIEWYCTPMYPESLDFLDDYVKRYEIRHVDSLSLHQNIISPIISKALKTNKEIIISSQKNPKDLELYKNKNIKWLYVIPKYPCSIEDIDFSELNYFDGYSNHCIDPIAPLTASILGSNMIEVHVTSDKSKNFLDNSVSFDPAETEKLVNLIRNAEKIYK